MRTLYATMQTDLCDQRVQALVAYFARVQRERMQDVPLLNPVLHVEAVDFIMTDAEAKEEAVCEGVLITPWFMSLLRLPLYKQAHHGRVGCRAVQAFGREHFDFMGAYDEAVGYYETCALFSPMFAFPTQDLARETARAALQEIREGAPAALPVNPSLTPPLTPPASHAVPARRLFLTGRGASRGGA